MPSSSRFDRAAVSAAVAVVVSIGLVTSLRAERLAFRSYKNVDGLPQSQVLAIHQDRSAEIWVGTWCGAARYDGADFRTITSQKNRLPSNYVYGFAEDPDGSLWVSAGGGLVRFASNDFAKPSEVIAPLAAGVNDSSVRDIQFDRTGTLWAAVQNGAVLRREGTDESGRSRFRTFALPPLDTDSNQLLGSVDGADVLVGTSQGIFRASSRGVEPWRESPGPWNEPIRLLHVPANGMVIFGTSQAVYRMEGDRLDELRAEDGGAIGAARSALVDRRSRLWIGTEAGLFLGSSTRLRRLGVSSGLPNERIYSLLEDREGNVWIGTDDGLAKLADDFARSYWSDDGLPSSSIWSLAIDRRGRLLVGTRAGLGRFEQERFETLPEAKPAGSSMIRAIVEGNDGDLWLGTKDDGLFRISGGASTRFLPPVIPDRRVYGAFRDRDGRLWFATRSGLARWNGRAFDLWRRDEGLPHETVWKIEQDSEGRIVVSTDRGLARLEGDRFVVPAEWERFAREEIRAFTFAKDGTLWVGTNGGGVVRWQKGSWTEFTSGRGPADDFVWGLQLDLAGRLWIATNHGIDVFDGTTWTNYSARDGLPADEISVNAAAMTPDGGVWFGTNTGLIRFNVKSLADPGVAPIVRIRSVKTGTGRRFDETASAIRIPWRERDLTFDYIGLAFRDERRTVYRTRLEGYDRDWTQPSHSRSVRYTNLEPGVYEFFVSAANAAGVWSDAPASLRIEILAPVWRTAWFRALAALAVLILVLSIVRRRETHLAREKARLEGLVSERTRTLEEKMQQLEDLKGRFEHLSVTDSLTGLSNRRYFLERIESEIARSRRHGEAIGIVLIDLDHFKVINDRFGHAAGDAVLVRFARLLEEWVRKSDLVARYGGEEFILAFLHTTREGSYERAEELRKHVESQTIEADGHAVQITLSAGFLWHDFAANPGPVGFDDLARLADQALYRAKAAGRNRVECAG